ncbi:MAG: hypothetical protein COA86_13355 [Kangiella sp.]|nr:MAG: hypothetical protein COA86_13355 [Kangiella sp.]
MKDLGNNNSIEIDVTTNLPKPILDLEMEKSTHLAPLAPLNIQSFESLKLATLNLFKQSKRLIQIYSFSLDKRILNNREIELTMTKLLRTSRYAKIQCLIYDEKELQGFDHRIVSLAQRFTSFIEIRVIPEDLKNTNAGYYIVDKQFMIYRSNRENYEALLFKQRQIEVKDKIKHFEDVWQQSRPASFLRALHL